MSSVKSFVSLKEKYDRICVLIDMDCFYCQVEEFLDEKRLSNKPIAVVQYLENAGIIAVNYAARALGVTRHMREKEAKAACPTLICVKVPSKNGKADLSKYRDAGYQVAKVLQTFTPLLERASVDEAYLDITDNVSRKMQEMRENKFQLQPANFVNSYAIGYENIGLFVQDVTSSVDNDFENVPEEDRKSYASSKLRLLIGAAIVNDIRAAVKKETRYECSAGIAHNKILAKLTCGMNKPNKQTILPIESIPGLFEDLAVNKVKSLGGKLGEEVCVKLNVKTMADLLKFSEHELLQHFQARVGSWLYWMARGIDLEKVTPKFMSKSIAVSKNFRGKNEISSILTLKFWLKELAKEIVERLAKDATECNRTARQMIVSFTQEVASSRTVPLNGNALNSYTAEQIGEEAFDTIRRNTGKFLKAEGTVLMNHNIRHLGISAGKFEDNVAPSTSKNLQDLLKNHQKKEVQITPVEALTKKQATKTVKSPGVSSLKMFEMKSPKGLIMKTSTEQAKIVNDPDLTENITESHPISFSNEILPTSSPETLVTESVVISIKDHAVNNLQNFSPERHLPKFPEVCMAFDGENAIKGVKTLKHWIQQLLTELCSNLTNDSEQHHRAPSELVLKYKQTTNNEKENVQSFPLQEFAGSVIDVEVIVSTLVGLDNFLSETGGIKNPIRHLFIIPFDFKRGETWSWTIKEESLSYIQIKPTHEAPQLTEEACENETDEEFFRNELKELDKEDTHVSESNPEDLDLESSGNYSPDPDIDHDSEDTMVPSFSVESEPEIVKSVEPKQSSTFSKTEGVYDDTAGPSYIKTYAEFQPHNLPIELLNPKEECAECGKMIHKLDMVCHLDLHLAFQISSQQREEFRNQHKSTQSTSTSSQSKTKKALKVKNQPIKKPVNLIERYAFKKRTSVENDDELENRIKCEQCLKHIAADEYDSHLDFHFAKSLQLEEKLSNKTSAPMPAPKVDSKRKRPATSQKDVPKMKSVKSYFSND